MFEKRNLDNFDWTWIADDLFTWNWFITYSKPYRDTPYNWPKQIIEYSNGFNCIIQAGGNAGMYAKFYAKHFNEVHTFEPDPQWWHCLTENCTEQNIKKYNVFLGDRENYAKTEMNPKEEGNYGALRTVISQDDDATKMITIDSLNLKPDMIQLDIEGYEYHALLGAKKTIENSQPIIVLETKKHLSTYGKNMGDVNNFLESLNYSPVKIYRTDCIYKHNGKNL